ncbi:Zinc finger, CCHC-type [Pseudocohnilembus persalinus]|uniref:Branchpoint-bridging protein n=1 Tax=Pseudocohnilembus persalinus TaxID=266149 RepID=A0A0V0QQ24_PSEPJ|nr:Zinc finger, CCHC-type [Pseudocohnilembus persalinus]|eukprot:KRX04301.1 Zinc finger, CCHC-type [Pseudocohnilembus persalinus]
MENKDGDQKIIEQFLEKQIFLITKNAKVRDAINAQLPINLQISPISLFYSMILEGANDSAIALAENFGILIYLKQTLQKSEMEELLTNELQFKQKMIKLVDKVKPIKLFIEKMNSIRHTLNLKNTFFTNVTGLSDKQNLTSVEDCAKLCSYCMNINLFSKDEIKIGDKTLFTIDHEHILNDEEQPKRKSKWGAKPDRKKKLHKPVVFDPLRMLMQNGPLAIQFGQNMNLQNQGQVQSEERKSRWGPAHEKTFHPPLLHYIPREITQDQLEYLIRCYRLDEMISQQEYNQETILDDQDCRSPSPPPEYNAAGQRTNTREMRAKDDFKREKNDLIEECMKIEPNFVPPKDYRPPKKSVKIYIPQQTYGAENNYVGRIIGPNGSTQKKLEKESKCKISLRGQGSAMNKRNEVDSNDKLHVFLQAETDEDLLKGQELVMEILGTDPNDKPQSNQLQVFQSFFQDDSQQICENCHERGHRSYACPKPKSKIQIKCEICGEKSHVTMDCPNKRQYDEMMQQKKAMESDFGKADNFRQFLQSVEGQNAQALLQQQQQSEQNKQNQAKERAQTYFLTDEVRSDQIKQITFDPNQNLLGADPYKRQFQAPEQFQNIQQTSQPNGGKTYNAHENIITPQSINSQNKSKK